MNPRWLLWTMRGALLVGLAVSTALLVDYSKPVPEFCSVGSGCDSVRRSGLGYIPFPAIKTYLPVPVLGLVGFGLGFGATLISDWQKRRRWSLALLAAGAFVGFGFLITQWVWIGALCSLCLTVNVASLVAATCAFALPKAGWQETVSEERGEQAEERGEQAEKRGEQAQPRGLKPSAWALLAGLFVLSPWLWPKIKPTPPVPEKILSLYQPGKINVVEFADFECPHCRRLHFGLKQIMADYQGQVHFVRRHMPLPRHEYARKAAHGAVCAERQGEEAAMADALFEADELDARSILSAAERLGLELKQFKTCLDDPATDRVIEEHSGILREAGFQGLPTTYVGGKKIVGAQSEEVFRAAFDDAKQGGDNRGLPGIVYWPLVLLTGLSIIGLGRLKGPGATKEPKTA